jgi:signal transduction histidine kinase
VIAYPETALNDSPSQFELDLQDPKVVRTLVEETAHLRADSEFRDRLLGVLAHDLRTPLSVIAMALQSLLRSPDLSDAHRKTVARAANNADRMNRLVRDLLDYVRGRLSGGIPVNPAPMDLASLVRSLVEELQTTNPRRQLLLEGVSRLAGSWDRDRLAQAISNLLSNAVQYSTSGSTIRVAVREQDATAIVEIQNQSKPIPREVLPQLFRPFHRGPTEAANQHPSGLGLGLYIAQQIAVSHSGTLQAQSTKGDGTMLIMRLPLHAPTAS